MLPAGRQFQGFAVLIPGVSRTGAQDVGGSSGDNFSTLAVHGSHAGDMLRQSIPRSRAYPNY